MKEVVKDFVYILEEVVSEFGVVFGLVDSIGKVVVEVSWCVD